LDADGVRPCPNLNTTKAKQQFKDYEENGCSNQHRNQNKGDRIAAERHTVLSVKDYPRKQAAAYEQRDEKQNPTCECQGV
jgi:hypothetical protein